MLFVSKPLTVEGWLFKREFLEDKASIPEWVATRLTIVADKFYLVDEQGNPYVEVLDGQWIMNLIGQPFPLTQEALDEGFEPKKVH